MQVPLETLLVLSWLLAIYTTMKKMDVLLQVELLYILVGTLFPPAYWPEAILGVHMGL